MLSSLFSGLPLTGIHLFVLFDKNTLDSGSSQIAKLDFYSIPFANNLGEIERTCYWIQQYDIRWTDIDERWLGSGDFDFTHYYFSIITFQ